MGVSGREAEEPLLEEETLDNESVSGEEVSRGESVSAGESLSPEIGVNVTVTEGVDVEGALDNVARTDISVEHENEARNAEAVRGYRRALNFDEGADILSREGRAAARAAEGRPLNTERSSAVNGSGHVIALDEDDSVPATGAAGDVAALGDRVPVDVAAVDASVRDELAPGEVQAASMSKRKIADVAGPSKRRRVGEDRTEVDPAVEATGLGDDAVASEEDEEMGRDADAGSSEEEIVYYSSSDDAVNDADLGERSGYGFLFKSGPRTFTEEFVTDDDWLRMEAMSWEQMCCRAEKYAARDRCMLAGVMGRANTYRNSSHALRERLKQKDVELAGLRNMKDNAAKALLDIETEKTDINHAYRFAVAKNELLTAENTALSAEVKSLEFRLRAETERANDAEAHLNSRPTEEAAIAKFKGSSEFAEAVKEVAAQGGVAAVAEIARLREEAVLAAAEIARLKDEASVSAAEIAMLKSADVAAAEEILRLAAKLDAKKKELADSKKVAKRRKREKRSLAKLLAQKDEVVAAADVEVAGDSFDNDEPDDAAAEGGDKPVVEGVPGELVVPATGSIPQVEEAIAPPSGLVGETAARSEDVREGEAAGPMVGVNDVLGESQVG